MIHEAPVATTTSSAFTNHVKQEEEILIEEDPRYDISQPQCSENVIQHLEIVPVDTESDKEV